MTHSLNALNKSNDLLLGTRILNTYEGTRSTKKDSFEKLSDICGFFLHQAAGKKIILHQGSCEVKTAHVALRILAGLAAVLTLPITILGLIFTSLSKSHSKVHEQSLIPSKKEVKQDPDFSSSSESSFEEQTKSKISFIFPSTSSTPSQEGHEKKSSSDTKDLKNSKVLNEMSNSADDDSSLQNEDETTSFTDDESNLENLENAEPPLETSLIQGNSQEKTETEDLLIQENTSSATPETVLKPIFEEIDIYTGRLIDRIAQLEKEDLEPIATEEQAQQVFDKYQHRLEQIASSIFTDLSNFLQLRKATINPYKPHFNSQFNENKNLRDQFVENSLQDFQQKVLKALEDELLKSPLYNNNENAESPLDETLPETFHKNSDQEEQTSSQIEEDFFIIDQENNSEEIQAPSLQKMEKPNVADYEAMRVYLEQNPEEITIDFMNGYLQQRINNKTADFIIYLIDALEKNKVRILNHLKPHAKDALGLAVKYDQSGDFRLVKRLVKHLKFIGDELKASTLKTTIFNLKSILKDYSEIAKSEKNKLANITKLQSALTP